MFECLLAPLLKTLRAHFGLSKTRLETLAVLLSALPRTAKGHFDGSHVNAVGRHP